MHGFPYGLFGDFNVLCGAWVFCPWRETEVFTVEPRGTSLLMPPALEAAGSTAQKPRERGPARNWMLIACQLRPLVGTQQPGLLPLAGGYLQGD